MTEVVIEKKNMSLFQKKNTRHYKKEQLGSIVKKFLSL